MIGNSDSILFVGHSHIECLVAAMQARVPEDRWSSINLRLLGHRAKSEGVPLVELLEEQLDTAFDRFTAAGKSRTSVIVSMRGNYHVVFGLLEPAQPFDFIHPECPELSGAQGAVIVPFGAIVEEFENDLKSKAWIFNVIRKRKVAGIYHIQTPPPSMDDEYIISELHKIFQDRNRGSSVAHRNLRYKLWKTYSNCLSEMCARNHVDFLHVPQNVMVEGKFLTPEGYGRDPTHGGEWYAQQWLRELGIEWEESVR
ncbi:hypothetical protein [Breoghania sp.]|uniref:hypothetical protein n=1 Tax=Breoghania sp. TaxID=2065378 RepID=UPI002AA8B97D|nr:hypothetical protein [Breoghania sp.]